MDDFILLAMKLKLYVALIGQLIATGASQFTEEPPTKADPNTVQDCTWWFVATASDTCSSIASLYGLTQAQLVQYVSFFHNLRLQTVHIMNGWI